jgi:hypothetical protein
MSLWNIIGGRTPTKKTVTSQESDQDLRHELELRACDLSEARERENATAEVLRIISNSRGDLAPVFEAILANATRLCEAKFGVFWLYEEEGCRAIALHNAPAAYAEERRRNPVARPGPTTGLGRVASQNRSFTSRTSRLSKLTTLSVMLCASRLLSSGVIEPFSPYRS